MPQAAKRWPNESRAGVVASLGRTNHLSHACTFYLLLPAQPNDIQRPGAFYCFVFPVLVSIFPGVCAPPLPARLYHSQLQTVSMGIVILKMRRLGCFFTQSESALFPILGAAHASPRMGTSPRILECARSTAQCWHIADSNGRHNQVERVDSSCRLPTNTWPCTKTHNARLRHVIIDQSLQNSWCQFRMHVLFRSSETIVPPPPF